MYSQKRIISTPISNNRLDFEKRNHPEIIVPKLIEGTLDDVHISEHIAIECEVDGKIVAGKGLENLVFLRNSRVPTWIMDNHNHAFAFWYEALSNGYIRPGALLIHIDQHTDLGSPIEFPKIQSTKYKVQNNGSIKNSNYAPLSKGELKGDGIECINNPPFCTLSSVFCTLDEVEEYTNSILTIADFIVPALADGLISEALMVTGEDMQTSQSYVWQADEESGKLKAKGEGLLKKLPQPLACCFPPSAETVIVDLDLDYFAQGFDEKICLENVAYWLEKADIVTIATSPLFIDQEKALGYLRKILLTNK